MTPKTSHLPIAESKASSPNTETSQRCHLPVAVTEFEGFDVRLCDDLQEAGCPMASHLKEQLEFEEFLFHLSSVFVNVKPIEVDSRIKSALQSIAEFLDIDRTGFGEVTSEGLLILQSYERPGISPMPGLILEEEFPIYMGLIQRGEVFRIPEDLPPEASRELDHCSRTGLLSNLTIPLMSMGKVVGGLCLELYRRRVPWPEELVHRLCLIGEIFSNARV